MAYFAFILNMFPDEAFTTNNFTCMYVNSFSGEQCGQPSRLSERGVPMSACDAHMTDYNLAILFRANHVQTPVRNWPIPEDDARTHTLTGNEGEVIAQLHPILQPTSHATTTYIAEDFPVYVEPEKKCAVCYESEHLLSLPCRHVTCLSCYNCLPVKTCPMCRSHIAVNFVRRLF